MAAACDPDNSVGTPDTCEGGTCKVVDHDWTSWKLPVADAGFKPDPAGETVYHASTGRTWQQAWNTCDALVLDGQSDWRLPSLQELYSLVDFSVAGVQPYVDATAFANTPFGMFWTSTQGPLWGSAKIRYTVSFGGKYGPTLAQTPGDSPVAYVRCVR